MNYFTSCECRNKSNGNGLGSRKYGSGSLKGYRNVERHFQNGTDNSRSDYGNFRGNFGNDRKG